ncbi:isocitrate lyase [Mesorhizobium sp. WSM4310]|uniref:isocitrate lyase n=1 Tax=Mesorhizobium sp. WSM4310 TaxID=2589883 RepID=UPI00115F11BA|nr:isocitrate lyase [Mesorhizobium sp. WSM4310]TRC82196.1 isocitrate lyase [Mesorhizobium sp. WSM4310]
MTDFYNLVPSAPEGRFDGIERPYSPEDVKRLRGSVQIRQSLAEMGANRLWKLIHEEDFVNALGAMSGNQAMQQVRAGLKAIYLSGWQVAADANTASAMYPDQSLYPANAAPELVKRINRTLQRADQIETSEGNGLSVETWFAPIVADAEAAKLLTSDIDERDQPFADAEAGCGGPLNAFEIMKAFIEAGAAGVHYEDQLASEKKCGHLGGKVLIPTAAHIRNLNAARLAADVMGTPTLVVARTDAEAAKLLTSDIDERDQPFVDYDAGRTVEGFYHVRNGIEPCIARAVAYAPHADLIWCETSKPDLVQAKKFAEGVRKHHPGKLLAYNCSPSFNWKKNLDDATIAKFQRELGAMGYKFQFITLAGFHQLNYGMFELARGYKERQMAAYSELQEAEFAAEANGYTATKHQREVGTGYFDAVSMAITGGKSSTTAMHESTEHAQFRPAAE